MFKGIINKQQTQIAYSNITNIRAREHKTEDATDGE